MDIETSQPAEPGRDPDGIRSRVEAMLAELPGSTDLADLPAQTDLNHLAQRLEEAHNVLVRALESVEKG